MPFKKNTAVRGIPYVKGQAAWNQATSDDEICETCELAKVGTSYLRLDESDLRLTLTKTNNERDVIPSSPVMLLRPRKNEVAPYLEDIVKSSTGTYVGHRFVDIEKVVDAINDVQKEHSLASPSCRMPWWKIPEENEHIRGLGVSARFLCSLCGFLSTRVKLYKEIPSNRPGRRHAVPNMALQVGLHQTSVAGSAVRRMLTAMSTPSPSMKSLQSTTNICGEIMFDSNQRDMQEKRKKVKDVQEYRGLDRDSPIAVEGDRQYNNPLSHGRRRTPFQPATQTRDVVVENVTAEKFIIAYHATNKLCRYGQRCVSQGRNPPCPNHDKCTATIRYEDNIGDELTGGAKCAEQLLTGPEQIRVKTITTDSDGHFAQGVTEVMKREGIKTESHLCLIHLNRSLARRLSSIKLEKQAMPATTARVRLKQQQNMADDFVHRVNAELRCAHIQYSSDTVKLSNILNSCTDAMFGCYSGQHDLCKGTSFVCQGNYHFPYLSKSLQRKVLLNTKDRNRVKAEISKQFTERMLRKTRLLTTTQKAESTHHAFSVTNSKHSSTFTRNFKHRDASAIHLTNSGPGISIIAKAAAANVPLTGGKRLRKQVLEMQTRIDYWRKRSTANKTSRATHRLYRYRLYEKKKGWKGKVPSEYIKGQLEGESAGVLDDHNYDRVEPDSDSDIDDIAD